MKKILIALLMSLTVVVGQVWGGNSASYFGGVGIDGAPRPDGSIVVRQLVLGGPAQVAGIQNGDVITHIDGAATAGSDFNDMVEHRLRGRAGTPVLLKVKRGDTSKPLIFKLVRRQLALPG